MYIKVKNNGEFQDIVLRGIKGTDGKSAYELALDAGFEGTEEEWVTSLEGTSAYELAVQLGYEGSEEEWILSLKGDSVPVGGTANQILKKNSSTELDYSWTSLDSKPTVGSENALSSDAAAQFLADKSISVNAEVPTSSWIADTTQDGYSYKATITVAGVTETNNIVVGLSSSSTTAQEEACGSAGMKCKEQGIDYIVIYAKEVPATDLTITVMILG